MADLSDYSDFQQKVIKEIKSNDRGFHTEFMIADYPFSEMIVETESGMTSINSNVTIPVTDGESEYNLNVYYSPEQKDWFFCFYTPTDEIRGVLHYNTIYNSMGEIAFAVLNDNIDGDMDMSLPYSNLLLLRK